MKKSFIVMILGLACLAAGCTGTPAATPTSEGTTSAAISAGAGAECDYIVTEQAAARPVGLPVASGVADTGTVQYTMTLNDKAVGLTLNRANAPCAVNSFVSLASQGFYDNTTCHRLLDVTGFYALQCGDPTATSTGGPGYRFAEELTGDETYPAGTLAMANSASLATTGSQFFIVYRDSKFAPDYTVFGKVDAAGLKVVNAIAAGGTQQTASGFTAPVLPAVVNSVKPS